MLGSLIFLHPTPQPILRKVVGRLTVAQSYPSALVILRLSTHRKTLHDLEDQKAAIMPYTHCQAGLGIFFQHVAISSSEEGLGLLLLMRRSCLCTASN